MLNLNGHIFYRSVQWEFIILTLTHDSNLVFYGSVVTKVSYFLRDAVGSSNLSGIYTSKLHLHFTC